MSVPGLLGERKLQRPRKRSSAAILGAPRLPQLCRPSLPRGHGTLRAVKSTGSTIVLERNVSSSTSSWVTGIDKSGFYLALQNESDPTKALQYINDQTFIKHLSYDDLGRAFALVESVILHQSERITMVLLLADACANPIPHAAITIKEAHKALVSIVNNASSAFLSTVITPQFLRRYFSGFETLHTEERSSLVDLLWVIYTKLPVARKPIQAEIEASIFRYIEDPERVLLIDPCISFHIMYLNEDIKGRLSAPFFKEFLFPLISTTLADRFFPTLSSAISIYFMNDNRLFPWALTYLNTHWPCTNSAKLCGFVKLSGQLMNASNEFTPTFLSLLKRIIKASQSDNYKVAITAIDYFCSLSYVEILQRNYDTYYSSIQHSICVACHHWNLDVQRAAFSALRIYSGTNFVDTYSENSSNEQDWKEHWSFISSFAGQHNGTDIDL